MDSLQSVASDFLSRILADKREEVAARRLAMPEHALRERAALMPGALSITDRLRRQGLSVIAEVKRGSPSAGTFNARLDAATQAARYAHAGAEAVSVLTDKQYFGGTLEDLQAVKGAVAVPVLRKDFIVDPYQIWEARAAGADMLLLIAAALGEFRLAALFLMTLEAGMSPFVEVHDPTEAAWATALDAPLVGINNRDLRTFAVDLDTTRRVRPLLPQSTVVVSLSGIKSSEDAEAMRAAGADGVLIGEALVKMRDPELLIASIRGMA